MNAKILSVFVSLGVAGALLTNLRAGPLDVLRNDDEVEMVAPFDPDPTSKLDSKVDKILVYAWDGDGQQLPVKTLKITNNHTDTVYPILRGANEAALSVDNNVGKYDPYDSVRHEFRGYIGYKLGNKYYFGLKKGQSILIRVPLVFWDGARIGLVSESEYLVPDAGKPNPLNYKPEAQRIITKAESDITDPSLIKNGVVMWYKASSGGPALDAPDQLGEWTIRDKDYLGNPFITSRTHGEIPTSERVNLINYDVSYVDNMFLPVAMEALDVPIPRPPYPPGRKSQPYGWIGAINPARILQNKIEAFTKDQNELLGSYFGGMGWPKYNIPIKETKIPAAQNVFAQSPLSDVRSSYNILTYMLSSGGGPNDPISVNIGGEGTASSGFVLTLSRNEPVEKIKFIKKDYDVVGHTAGTNPIQPGTKVVSVDVDARTVTLDKELVATQEGANFDFIRPPSDYASQALIKLWYSWAQRYIDRTKDTKSQMLEGSIGKDSATLFLNAPQKTLIEGMQVTGPGLPNPDPAKNKGGVVILQMATDGKSVTLSQLASDDQQGTYTFEAPKLLPSTPASLYKFDFSADPEDPPREPEEFAKNVYLIMASMAQIPKNPDPDVKSPHVIELMINVVGGNMGFIFDTDARRYSGPGLTISAIIRDMIKSVLRGVTDFTKYPERDTDGKFIWYPDPKVGRGNQTFNVFNLDPFVRFVHVDLSFSGYGFSLDDDTADVGAGQATKFLLTIGGPPTGNTGPNSGMVRTRENANEWTIQAPYGEVVGTGAWDPKDRQSFYLAITNATNASPIVITSVKHGLGNGDKVFIDQVNGNGAANSPVGGEPFTVVNVTKDTFELEEPTGSGNYISGGRWTFGPLPYISFDGNDLDGVFWRVKGDDRNAGFQGAIITGPGIQGKGTVRVVQLGNDQKGQLAISIPLTKPNGDPLPPGKNYRWIFSGK